MLQRTITIAAKEGIKNIQIGMAHRGRLNVLTHVLEKPYEMMISEFMHTDPMKFLPEDGSLQLTAGWTGDVKYHLGGIKLLIHTVQCSVLHWLTIQVTWKLLHLLLRAYESSTR